MAVPNEGNVVSELESLFHNDEVQLLNLCLWVPVSSQVAFYLKNTQHLFIEIYKSTLKICIFVAKAGGRKQEADIL